MGMSTHVIGFRPPDAKFKKMQAAYEACVAAGVDIPDDVSDFFNGESPDESGVEVEIDGLDCVEEYSDDMRDGYEIDVTKLPKGVTKVRVYNSY